MAAFTDASGTHAAHYARIALAVSVILCLLFISFLHNLGIKLLNTVQAENNFSQLDRNATASVHDNEPISCISSLTFP